MRGIDWIIYGWAGVEAEESNGGRCSAGSSNDKRELQHSQILGNLSRRIWAESIGIRGLFRDGASISVAEQQQHVRSEMVHGSDETIARAAARLSIFWLIAARIRIRTD
jgi:hypothetical protein